MVAFNFILALSTLATFVTAYPTNERLPARQVNSDTMQTTSDSRYRRVTQHITSLGSQIKNRHMSKEQASSEIGGLANELRSVLDSPTDCSNCQGTDTTTIFAFYFQISVLINICYETYGESPDVLNPLQTLDGSIHKNLQQISNTGVNLSSVVPSTLATSLAKTGLTQTPDFINRHSGAPHRL